MRNNGTPVSCAAHGESQPARYKWGSANPQGFDCSELVNRVMATTATLDPQQIQMPGGSIFTPALVTVPEVELLEVGEDWETSTGVFTFTEDDLVSAIESQDDPAVRTPVVKLGHIDPRFDGQPTLGRIQNLRLSNNKQTLIGDLVGVPQWLASVMASAYPRRSIEGNFSMGTRTGNVWDFILTGVALLGDAYPAIDTLEDIQAIWGAEIPTLYPVDDVEEVAASGNFIRARRLTDVKWKSRKSGEAPAAAAPAPDVQAASSVDDVRNAYYDSLGPAEAWWWIRSVLVNPLQLVVDDDMGNLWLVDVTADADDNIAFGEPTAVKVEYVAASGLPQIRKPGQIIGASYQTPAETGRPVRATQHDSEEQEEEERTMLTEAALTRLGLQPGATEEEISAAILAQANEGGDGGEGDGGTGEQPPADAPDDGNGESQPQTPATAPEAQPTQAPAGTNTPVIPEGMTLIDNTTLESLQTGVAASNKLVAAAATKDRDDTIAAAVRVGKFSKSRVKHFNELWAADAEGTRELISKLAEGIVPVNERGTAGETDPTVAAAQSQYPESWKPVVAATSKKVGAGSKIKVVSD